MLQFAKPTPPLPVLTADPCCMGDLPSYAQRVGFWLLPIPEEIIKKNYEQLDI